MTGLRNFAPRAARDIEDAAGLTADHGGGPDAAARILDRPQLGQLRPDLLPTRFRFWAVRGFPYLLIYDASRSPPQVLRVLHMARDLPGALTGLEGA